ncbi:preprotein translocase subunit SecG [Alkalithermobacter thermoalcaliphilus JW-YL-7 = DSM 7308]|uniref:Protein-export membrane protein SecG n=1 Tax=Alkalithermobacter thermoalcaliphilus JW-YL-7 = DSM 7308 TaxID=1121328 RepID=A0A150FRL9_CLOPD|nr:preprotein translocase, SecG subunit [[Clostridium] paradoxum JW-YL-7 = DSM 7308]SHK40908.1 preprotein translocase subunit SecG [[Clostridium] paradoxum JW-YL-7 = DSM 7308]
MKTFLMVLQLVVSIVLIVSVLLQSGKGSGMAEAFGGGSNQMSSTRLKSTDNILAKVTGICATLFILIAVSLLAIQ